MVVKSKSPGTTSDTVGYVVEVTQLAPQETPVYQAKLQPGELLGDARIVPGLESGSAEIC